MDELLRRQEITIHDIDLFAAGIGPGSFTGIRIAVSTMRMAAQLTGKPLIGIPTPLLYAVSIKRYGNPGDRILIALDARKDRIFGAVYGIGGIDDDPGIIAAPGDHMLDDLLIKCGQKKPVAAGNGIMRFIEKIKDAGYEPVIPGTWLDGDAVCDLAYRTWKMEPEKYSNPFGVVPLYIRKSDAETARGR